MTTIIGGNGADLIVGVAGAAGNRILGDGYSQGAFFDPDPGSSAILDAGRGGNDLILLPELTGEVFSQNIAFGDAYVMAGTGRGGNDVLAGKGSYDDLSGDAYDMAGSARGGNDLLVGEGGNDELAGDAGSEMAEAARGGNDLLYGGADNDDLYGETITMRDQARGGNDLIEAGAGNDGFVYGDASGMRDDSRGGNDRVFGGDGNDTLHGDGNSLSDAVRGGNDQVDGGAGDDWIDGDAGFYTGSGHVFGDDRLFGGAGNDRIWGDARSASVNNATFAVLGDDRIDGGAGDDALWGDVAELDAGDGIVAGADRFVFARGSGNDTVGDFGDADGSAQDLIDLDGYRGLRRFADLDGHIADGVDGAVIDLGAAAGRAAGVDTITLSGIEAAQLGADDFRF